MRPRRAVLGLLLAAACGSRTGLLLDDVTGNPGTPGASVDGGGDATAPLPRLDAAPRPDVDRSDCPNADDDAVLVYVMTDESELFGFYPPERRFIRRGTLRCPSREGSTPFSMAVNRRGIAYVLFNDGDIFEVDARTAACRLVPEYTPGSLGLRVFGMGFASNEGDADETLFLAADENTGTGNSFSGLGFLTPAFETRRVGPFVSAIHGAELTGTGEGRLFAFYAKVQNGPTFIGELDKASARVVAETPLPDVRQGTGWAFASWGGDFYVFTAAGASGPSTITRHRPSDGTTTELAQFPARGAVVGAGVSTCAPSR